MLLSGWRVAISGPSLFSQFMRKRPGYTYRYCPSMKVHFRAVKPCIDVYTTHIFTQPAGHFVPSKTAAGQEIRANFI